MNKNDEKSIKTIDDVYGKIGIIDGEQVLQGYKYQEILTRELDIYDGDFDDGKINEIILWKNNKYARIDKKTIGLLNKIEKTDNIIPDFFDELFERLIKTKGIKLPMASTILRFKNPNIFQIIDARAYRVLYRYDLKFNDKNSLEIYKNYLEKLKEMSKKHGVDFIKTDRVFYILDKEINKGIPIH